jgi:hypothetical protein
LKNAESGLAIFTLCGRASSCQQKAFCCFYLFVCRVETFFGNNFTIRASYSLERSPMGRAAGAIALPEVHRKDEFTMKKLLALLIIGGLLGLTTGCPQGTTGPTGKKPGEGKSGFGSDKDKGKMGPGSDKMGPGSDKDKDKMAPEMDKDKDKGKAPPAPDKDKDKAPPTPDKDKDKDKGKDKGK